MASWRHWLVAGALLLLCADASAAVRIRAATLSLPGIEATGVSIDAGPGVNGVPEVRIQAARLSVPAFGWRNIPVIVDGRPQRADGGAWEFTGHIAARGAPGGALSDAMLTVVYDRSGGTLQVDLSQGQGKLEAMLPLDQASHVQMKLAALPLVWLRGMLASAWPDGRLNGGTVAGDVAVDVAAGSSRVTGRVSLAGVAVDSKSGRLAAQKLGAAGAFRIRTGAGATGVMFDGQLRGGELLVGPLYALLPPEAVGLHLAADLGAGGTTIESLDFDDPDALRLTGALGIDRNGQLTRLSLTRFDAVLPLAYARYGTTLVQNLTGIRALTASGHISGSMDLDGRGLRALAFRADGVNLDSRSRGLAVAGLNGGIDWRAGVSRPATSLRWNALSAYRLVFGAATFGFKDDAGTLALQAPVDVGSFGGTLQLAKLDWRPDLGKSQRLSAALSVSDVDVDQLCAALGWPAFGGKLGGAVPNLSYRGNDLVFDGGLSLGVFGGSVSVTHLSLQRPFGVTPKLAADVDISQLDLAPLTGVFGFGQITGRLDGSIRGLRMVDWRPVAFTADLTANGGGRISQNAIKSLTEVGGGGIGGGLQGIALRVFKTFGYARLGLSCRLANGVCTMGGLDPDPDPDEAGYTIVEGSGLPHITVIGHERSVDWATLVSRLKAVTEGARPVVK